ncbi:hypothetical protein Afil01_57600 [Actinorhabdospora filicis]|uniref:N-acetyltransferase domain-containing protein n=1 Tax=Actinorhabdospora filicis TaxID=1785913 RepID=A0A9W6SRV7_9ACTN|nr:GNAT family N-acetyltransferase [Actinorhabdospora filicis]GLZ80953.1 hypothetical protein Afil01_57600 [Actinorhabdospora filicis]
MTSSLSIRALTPDTLHLFHAYPHSSHPSVGREASQDYSALLAQGKVRPEWTFVAVRDDVVIARAAFFGRPDSVAPLALDWFELGDSADRVAVGTLLAAHAYAAVGRGGMGEPEFNLLMPPDWRSRDDIAGEIADRCAAIENAGLVVAQQRFGFRWEPSDGLPARSVRLTFVPGTDAEFLAAIRAGLPGTLDGHTVTDLARGEDFAAEQLLDSVITLPGRDDWRLARDAGGAVVGAIFPTVISNSASIGYITVAADHRGRGYVNDLLAEGLHVHAGNGRTVVTASTDLANAPMKAAFDRAGFRTVTVQLDYWPGLVFRSLGEGDTELFGAYPHAPVEGVGYEDKVDWRRNLAEGHYKPHWMWVAIEGGVVRGRMAFWGFPADTAPKVVDWFEPGDDVEVGAGLMRAAYATQDADPRPEYALRTPAGWRDTPLRGEVEARVAAAERAGLSVFVERHGFRWTAERGLPERSARLRFREGTDEEFVDAVREGFPGTLDAYTREDCEKLGAQATAEQEVAGFADYPAGRDWWRLAENADGEVVGAIFPARNYDSAIICYITVVAGHRGNGYVHDLLAEMLHIHAENGAESVGGHTDLPNLPMKAAFLKAGFAITGGRIDLR